MVGADHGAIAASGNLDEQRVGVALAGVVLEEARAEPSGFDADGGVDGWVIGVVTIEDVEGDAVLLERLAGMVEGVLDDVTEKQLAAMGACEDVGAEDALELDTCRAVGRQRVM